MRLLPLHLRLGWLRMLAAFVPVLAFSGCASVQASSSEKDFKYVSIVGVQHIGSNFNISDFYVNGHGAGKVGRAGGGSPNGMPSSVALPEKWRPGLTVDVRWAVGDWSKENLSEMKAGNYTSITSEGVYKAIVPVEKYDVAARVYIHFYAGGRVRAVSSSQGVLSKEYPILRDDPHAADSATIGAKVDALFTKEELDGREQKRAEDKKKYGDWR